MKAIILASGTGSRLLPITNETPKSLLDLNGRTILDLEMESLIECGVDDIVITTGFRSDKMDSFVSERYPDLKIQTIYNEKFASTNNIYSLWLARDAIHDEAVLLHGDMVFEKELMRRLLNTEDTNAVLVNTKIEPPEKDFKALITDGKVRSIGVDLKGDSAFFCAPVYKISQMLFRRWLDTIDAFVRAGDVNCYAENALNGIMPETPLSPVYYDTEFCMEIDTHEDLEKARKHFSAREGN